jgi:hypothetical protein
VRLAGDRLHGLGDRGRPVAVAQRPVLNREHDRRRVAGLGREALGEQVVRLLGLGARRVEVVRESGPRSGKTGERDEGDEDEKQGALPVMSGGAGEAPEEEGHALSYRTLDAIMQ